MLWMIFVFTMNVLYYCRVIDDTKISSNWFGHAVAAMGSLTTALHQVLTRYLQISRNVESSTFVKLTILPQALLLLFVAPFFDFMAFGKSFPKTMDTVTIAMIVTSAFTAGLLNISTAQCLNFFTAVSFQVLGYMKTMVIYLSAVVIFEEALNKLKIFGIILTVTSTVIYYNPEVLRIIGKKIQGIRYWLKQLFTVDVHEIQAYSDYSTGKN